jgi:hypothetical protein
MLTSRRDYILRLIDEVGRLLARVIFKRRAGQPEEALQTVVQACERLFGMEAAQLFQFTPEHHYVMLAEGETAEIARDKILLYAALNREAGQLYTQLGNRPMARASLVNALRLTLKTRADFPSANLPDFAPDVADLLEALSDAPLDGETNELVRAQLKTPPS